MTDTPGQEKQEEPQEKATSKPTCGIVMPISECDGQPARHWEEVLRILKGAIEKAGFEAELVSHAEDVGIIHERIIQNLYANDMVVCDVSGKNANVMFELGMRLTFNKATVIVRDDSTSNIFDIDHIERVEYRRDLRFYDIVNFQDKLAGKLKATREKVESQGEFRFLQYFGTFEVRELETKEVSEGQFIVAKLNDIERQLRLLDQRLGSTRSPAFRAIARAQDASTGTSKTPQTGFSVSPIESAWTNVDELAAFMKAVRAAAGLKNSGHEPEIARSAIVLDLQEQHGASLGISERIADTVVSEIWGLR